MAKKKKKFKQVSIYQKKTEKASTEQGISFTQSTLQQALTLHQSGRFPEAEALYRQILSLEPNNPDVLHNLGLLAYQEKNIAKAFHLISKALNYKPDLVNAHNSLGLLLIDLGKLDKAVASFNRALALKPDFAMAHYNLGNVLIDQGKLDEAAVSFRSALDLKQDYVEAYINLGGILDNQGKLDEALNCYHQALLLRPDDAELYNSLARILRNQGKMDEAVAKLNQAVALKPEYAEAYYNLGVIYRELGKMDDAITCYRKALSLKPDLARAYMGLSSIVKHTQVDDVISSMEDLYNKKGDIPDEDRIILGFALGKAFDDIGDHEKAFHFILEANRLRRRSYEYSIQEDRELFERTKKIFSPDFFALHHGSGNHDKTPIFILGMPRSGTTLIEQILASHPAVFGAGELEVLKVLINSTCTRISNLQFPECILDLDRTSLEMMGSEYIAKIRKYSAEAEFITDKLPYNFLRIGVIKLILPNAKIVHCMRSSMDNCFSIFKLDFKGAHGYAYDMVELGQYYNLYRDLMAHWEKVLPGFIYTLRYEEMVSDQQHQTRNLLDFCGLPWNENCLTFYKTERRVSTASFVQVRQPIYRDSIELWRQYEKQLEPLRKAIYR